MIRCTRSLAVLVLSLTIFGVLAAPTFAAPGGNSANAKQCQKGGWASLAPAEDPFVAFGSEEACTSYGAKGGTIGKVQNPAVPLCKEAAIAAGLNPEAFTIVPGTEGPDTLVGTGGADLICGFGGDDNVRDLYAGDVFLGGGGNDTVLFMHDGTFLGGGGADVIGFFDSGTFDGGAGGDRVTNMNGGTFNGGDDNDYVYGMDGGTTNGGAGDDRVDFLMHGTFNGGDGNDSAGQVYGDAYYYP